MKLTKRAIFLDRDGVINKEKSYITHPDQFELLPHVAKAIKTINKHNDLAIIVTNQSAISRGLCTEQDLHAIHDKMLLLLQRSSAHIDDIFYATYHPDFCEPNDFQAQLRKPHPGMLLAAQKKYHISLPDSWIIGDQERDLQAGLSAGTQAIGIRSEKKRRFTSSKLVFDSLFDAINYIYSL